MYAEIELSSRKPWACREKCDDRVREGDGLLRGTVQCQEPVWWWSFWLGDGLLVDDAFAFVRIFEEAKAATPRILEELSMLNVVNWCGWWGEQSRQPTPAPLDAKEAQQYSKFADFEKLPLQHQLGLWHHCLKLKWRYALDAAHPTIATTIIKEVDEF
jgi:hypothetical protein